MENQNTKENIDKILDYWYTIDFLGQDNFPSGQECIDKMEKHKEKLKQGKEDEGKTKYLKGFAKLDDIEIEQTVEKQVLDCSMNCWGNITVYIGKIKRETCIKKLISRLGMKDNRPEESTDCIALAAFQITEEGNYIEESLSLSPVLWSVRQIEEHYKDVSKQISNGEYSADNSRYEYILVPEKSSKEPYHVDIADIHRLYDAIWNEYIKDVFVEEYKELENAKSYVVKYQMFVDERAKEKFEDDTYTGLSKNYFSYDLKMLIDKNKKNELSQTMQDYILMLYYNFQGAKRKHRVDVIQNNDHEEYEQQLNHILRMKNAPLGKWPSQYMPALMQQVAINLLVGKESRKMFGENGIVFSVNGPPGTGKTTLLKEVVVNNIVERAALLAEYEHPDYAFVQKNFEHGSKEEHAYSKFVRHWYKLKNDRINDYSILVASNNNTAVENISKELPVGKDILDDLKPNDNVSEVIRVQLDEVSELFDVSKSDDIEELSKETSSDIYFTKYANDLLDIDNAWGLIAAPLGKKSNKKNFYYEVLSKLLIDFYQRNSTVEARTDRYHEARKRFRKQYNLVKELQEQLDQYGELSEKRIAEKREKNKIIAQNNLRIDMENEELSELKTKSAEFETRLRIKNNEMKSIVRRKNEEEMTFRRLKEECELLENQLIEVREKIVSVEDSIGIFARLFKSRKYKSAMEHVEAYRMKGDRLIYEINSNQTQVEKSSKNLIDISEIYDKEKEKIEKLNEEKNDIQRYISNAADCIRKMETETSKAQDAINAIEKKYADKISEFKNTTIERSGIILDQNYIQKIYSNDEEEATQAQVINPWTTQLYNREREKLFYYAMKMNKEFVLSSKACRDNFKSLGHYWGYLSGDDNKKVEFRESCESGCVTALIQTLFLLVPVISSTFASVGSFFRDVREREVIGLLVVDEAGQAQPHMAAGALYRARKAMVVGDPKQVEPVVTDELKLLKETFDEEIFKPYKEKNVSVQLCADLMNPFGTFMDNGSNYPDWVGCPLLVHRRCITPMYDISNELSYNGMMKQQTRLPKSEVTRNFIYSNSQWINICGEEKGNKNHFVEEQGREVCKMLEMAFEKSVEPDVYIISPFKTVVNGLKEYIRSYRKTHKNGSIQNVSEEWMKDNIGTVHTFQGKEAKEVIFLLGCDGSTGASGAINWVNKNIVNVAVTRAKYRLYVVGNEEAWRKSSCMSLVQRYLKKEMLKSEAKNINCEV